MILAVVVVVVAATVAVLSKGAGANRDIAHNYPQKLHTRGNFHAGSFH